jgi:hypothetical protein
MCHLRSQYLSSGLPMVPEGGQEHWAWVRALVRLTGHFLRAAELVGQVQNVPQVRPGCHGGAAQGQGLLAACMSTSGGSRQPGGRLTSPRAAPHAAHT